MNDEAFADVYQLGMAIDSELTQVVGYGLFSPCYLEFYRRIGCLPEAMRHYLLGSTICRPASLLKQEEPLDDEGVISQFLVSDVNSEPESFDMGRLWRIQRNYMRGCSFARKCWLVNEFLRAVKLSDFWPICYPEHPPDVLESLVGGLSNELVVGGDILRLTDYFDDDLSLRDGLGESG